MDLLFVGVGWTDRAMTLSRIAVGAFFMLSGYHKLFNAERHRLSADELKGLGVPALGLNQWWVPLVEFSAGGAVLIGLFGATRRAWPARHHPCRHRDVRAAAD
jgi:putative oxidoreductase